MTKITKPEEKAPVIDKQDDNQNPWMRHAEGNQFWRAAIPVEVQYLDGGRKILRVPQHYKNGAQIVKFWRFHKELEKMPYLYKFEWFRQFTWKDRFKIFFLRKNLLVLVGIAMRNNVGNTQPVAMGYMTDSRTPAAHMEEQRKAAVSKYLEKGAKDI